MTAPIVDRHVEEAPDHRLMATPMHDQLPAHFAADEFLRRYMLIFEKLSAGVRAHGDSIEYLLDPRVAPPGFVRWLGAWLGVLVEPSLPEDHQRRIVREAAALFGKRGTPAGLTGVLSALTGGDATVDDEGGIFAEGESTRNTKHVIIKLETAGKYRRDHLQQVTEGELPADVTYELWIGDELINATTHLHGADYPVGIGIWDDDEDEPFDESQREGQS